MTNKPDRQPTKTDNHTAPTPPKDGREGDNPQLSAGISMNTLGDESSPERRLQDSLNAQGGQSLFEASGTLEPSHAPIAGVTPRTGVGTPDERAQAAGAELGGDTGDVGTPRNEAGDSQGGTAGTSGIPEGSTVVVPGKGKRKSELKKRAA